LIHSNSLSIDIMQRYQPPRSRPAFAFASIAMTAITPGLGVVLPAHRTVAAGEPPGCAQIGVAHRAT
jgi:hypothetical protein